MIYIRKESGKPKNALRIMNQDSIPEFLKKTIWFEQDILCLDCVEGMEKTGAGAVIGYEKSNRTVSGWNAWVIGNAEDNLIEKDGKFYTKPTILKAELMTDHVPSFLTGAEIRQNPDLSWSIKTDWGESTGYPGKSYWILYGETDGHIDANILSVSEKSFSYYFVCDVQGKVLGSLEQEYNREIEKLNQ